MATIKDNLHADKERFQILGGKFFHDNTRNSASTTSLITW